AGQPGNGDMSRAAGATAVVVAGNQPGEPLLVAGPYDCSRRRCLLHFAAGAWGAPGTAAVEDGLMIVPKLRSRVGAHVGRNWKRHSIRLALRTANAGEGDRHRRTRPHPPSARRLRFDIVGNSSRGGL